MAVAGVVAAGSTAFTGAGLTNGITNQKTFLGGTVSHTVVGANLTAMAFTNSDITGATTKVTAFTLDFNADALGKAVAISGITGTPGSSNTNDPDGFTCTVVGAAPTYRSTCSASVAGVANVNGWYSTLGAFSIEVS
ncbi:hypothetical protein ADL15_11890 [Actinoplanes awajinensis subsp. mycoplanecinus]|uniref:Uncharacterized protein n=1 Tax=Actinoplanes awajinensis subsp. mycoplanecinus TaxID=135947 RepID=A0A0X3UVG1_9ACTN|nr:hypothetical protein ADL15_11890 [Actinoplanes awajinensis subsp. mycoplanecinus]